jgi:hypothetical protein
LTSYDADTGRQRWNVPGTGNGWSPVPDRVVVDEPGEVGEQYLIDAETGRRVGETAPARRSGTPSRTRRCSCSSPPDAAEQTSITRWDLATGRRDLLGAIDRIVVNRCQAVAHLPRLLPERRVHDHGGGLMTLIDLGEVTEDDSPRDPAQSSTAPAGLPRDAVGRRLASGRRVGARTAEAELRPLWTTAFTEDDSVALAGDTAFVSRLDEDLRPSVAAYDLESGALRWNVPTGAGLGGFPPRPAGDTVLAPTDPVTMTYEDDGQEPVLVRGTCLSTVALDTATGDQLWRAEGDAVPSVPTRHHDRRRAGRPRPDRPLRVVRTRDGGEIWNRPVPPLAGWRCCPTTTIPRRSPRSPTTAGSPSTATPTGSPRSAAGCPG